MNLPIDLRVLRAVDGNLSSYEYFVTPVHLSGSMGIAIMTKRDQAHKSIVIIRTQNNAVNSSFPSRTPHPHQQALGAGEL